MMIKAIVLDIDGTLTNDDKEISLATRKALLAAQDIGVKVILASGRPTTGMLRYADQLELPQHHGLLVSYNGAKVTDCTTKEELFSQTLSVAEGKAVLTHLQNFDLKIMIDKDDYLYVHNVYDNLVHYDDKSINIIEYEARGGNYKLCEIDQLADFLDFPLHKILTAGDADYLAQHAESMAAPFVGKLNSAFTAPFYYEFTAQGIDKAKALDTVLTPLGIRPEEVIAFGDGHNDRTMLAYAGTGVAMANAVPELKAMADHITLSNNEDGIAHHLQQLVH